MKYLLVIFSYLFFLKGTYAIDILPYRATTCSKKYVVYASSGISRPSTTEVKVFHLSDKVKVSLPPGIRFYKGNKKAEDNFLYEIRNDAPDGLVDKSGRVICPLHETFDRDGSYYLSLIGGCKAISKIALQLFPNTFGFYFDTYDSSKKTGVVTYNDQQFYVDLSNVNSVSYKTYEKDEGTDFDEDLKKFSDLYKKMDVPTLRERYLFKPLERAFEELSKGNVNQLNAIYKCLDDEYGGRLQVTYKNDPNCQKRIFFVYVGTPDSRETSRTLTATEFVKLNSSLNQKIKITKLVREATDILRNYDFCNVDEGGFMQDVSLVAKLNDGGIDKIRFTYTNIPGEPPRGRMGNFLKVSITLQKGLLIDQFLKGEIPVSETKVENKPKPKPNKEKIQEAKSKQAQREESTISRFMKKVINYFK